MRPRLVLLPQVDNSSRAAARTTWGSADPAIEGQQQSVHFQRTDRVVEPAPAAEDAGKQVPSEVCHG